MFKRVSTLLILLTGIAALFLGACSKQKSTAGKVVTFNLAADAKTIDPQLGTTTSSARVLAMCKQGLTILGPKPGEVLPGGAESWDISKDGSVYIFHLRKNAKWSNGETVTAHDYLFGMKRALEPSTAAQYAYMLYQVKNAEDYNQNKIKDFFKVGIKVIDEFTLQITLNNQVPYFTQLLANSVTFPLNEKFYNKVKKQYSLTADTLLYNGAYIIKNYVPNGKYIFTKNKYFWNKDSIKVENMTFLMVNNYNTAANMFQTGSLDMTLIKAPQIPQFKNTKALKSVPNGVVWYLQYNVDRHFFTNVNIRRAVALAINREVMCKNILKNGSEPAYAFVPPGMFGGKVDGKLITFRKRYGANLFDPNIEEAKRLYKMGLKDLGYDVSKEGKAKVTLLCESDPSTLRTAQFIQQQLFKNLGLNVILQPNTFQARISKMSQRNYDFVLAGWGPDYNYPTTFLNMWVTGGGNNDTNFSNTQYDKDVNIGQTSDNRDARMTALNKAEVLLMKEMPIAPLYYGYGNWLVKPWLKGVVIRNSGTQISFQWAYVDKK